MLTQALFRALDGKAIWLIGALLLVAVAVPMANLMIPPGQFGHVPTYAVSLFGKYLSYAMLALALDLVWGYCGILSLGHGAFFALGGYAMGMYLMRQIGTRGVYGHPVLPDFMVFLNYSELPWYWLGFDNFWFAMLMVVLVPGLLAFVFGFLAFRSRVTGVYLSIITQAMTFALLLAFFRNDMGFGGNNGMTDFKEILGFPIAAQTTRVSLFSATAVALALSVLVCSAIVNSKLGKVMVAVRDAESRTRFLGYRVEYVKLFAFVVSAIMAGIAGALYVPQVGIINPGEFEPSNSIEVVIWTAVGGRGTIIGPIIGAVIVNMGKSYFTSALPEFWLFALGALFVFVTLFMPKGIVGLIGQWRRMTTRREQSAPTTAAGSGPPRAGREADAAERGTNPATMMTDDPHPKPAE
jgi:urea transport system permease protein